MIEITNNCCVKLKGSIWLVVGPPCPCNLDGHLGTAYGSEEAALKARDPGEIVVEIHIADKANE